LTAATPTGPEARVRLWWSRGALLFFVLVAAELFCRAIGLHQPLLYETSHYGYRVKPDQDIRRFGNRYFSNSFGLRSESITPLPGAGVLRILCLGDSITNGGAITDQAQTYPNWLERQLRVEGREVEVLNASAPGWAIANQAGWLRANGLFGARVLVLTTGGSDLYQPAAQSALVGSHPSFPSSAPWLALHELVARYVLPRLFPGEYSDPGADRLPGPSPVLGEVVEQILSIMRGARAQGAIPVVLYVERPGLLDSSNPHMQQAKTFLFQVLEREHVAVSSTREAVDLAGGEALFRDGLHPNAGGNRILALTAARLLEPVLGETGR
jgi:lysophospholipase L1-like esterase